MRRRFRQQTELGVLPIGSVEISKKSRHELPPTLYALQRIFVTPELNEGVFDLLEKRVVGKKKHTGRYGMDLWELLVLGMTRLTLNIDYDHLTDMANNHKTLRGILGVWSTVWNKDKEKEYKLQTIKDNVKLLDEETLLLINDLVVGYCHEIKKKEGDKDISNLRVKADSFVVESKVHFPTDLNLLKDACHIGLLSIKNLKKSGHKIPGWYHLKSQRKNLLSTYRSSSEIHRLKGKNYKARLKHSTKKYLEFAEKLGNKFELTLLLRDVFIKEGGELSDKGQKLYEKLNYGLLMVRKFIDLVSRRILKGEVIPASEKLYSLHEPHVEWNSKGKKNKKVELGHNVGIATDQYGFILYSKVYEKEVDKSLTIKIGTEIYSKYSKGNEKLESISFDRGFYSKPAKVALKKLYKNVVLPKPGKKNSAELTEEDSDSFKKYKKSHSTVEANINMLEHHGLNICPDKGIEGFKRYVAYGVLACNLHAMGKMLLAIEEKAKKKLAQAA